MLTTIHRQMPRFKLTRATCVLVLSAALTFVIFFYTTGTRAEPHHPIVHNDDFLSQPDRSEPDSQKPFGDEPQGREGRQWPWMAYFTSGEMDRERDAVKVVYADDGLARGWDTPVDKEQKGFVKLSENVRKRHPIYDLITRGQKRWKALLERQSKTLPQAVLEYRRRYGRHPPKGFEAWWRFARQNNIKIVDDYDQIHRDVSPYFALSPELFRKRCDALEHTPHSYRITLDPNGPSSVEGERALFDRPQLLFSLLEPIAQYLPRSITFYGSDHDLGSALLGADQLDAAMLAVEEGRYMSEEELRGYEKTVGRKGVEVKGTASACPVGSLAWNMTLAKQRGEVVPEVVPETTFVHDPLSTYDFCSNPSHLLQHGAFSFNFPRDTVLRPLFQWSKHLRNPEFLATPLEAYENATSWRGKATHTPWNEKSDSRVFWRGKSTGDAYTAQSDYRPPHWSMSHRPRLHLMAQEDAGTRRVWVQRGREWRHENWAVRDLNKAYLDVGLTSRPHQCKEEDGTCQEMRDRIEFLDRIEPEDAVQYKFALDVDGNGWSSRFHRLIMSGSVVIKSTIYPEWLSDWIIPWVHYVPIQVDYSDLYDVMSFFTGSPDPNDRHRQAGKGEDELARQIARQAREFGENHWRWEDMQGYMFRLLLEYARLQADDRDEWSYKREY